MSTQAIDLASAPSSPRSRLFALAIGTALVTATIAISYSVRLQGPIVPAFIPAIYSAATLAYVLTAFLFANQYVTSRSPGFAVLSMAYAYVFALTIPYLLSFPGVFAPGGLLGAGPSTAGWLYVFARVGFILLAFCYAITEIVAESRGRATFRAPVTLAIIAIATVAGAVAGTSLAFGHQLPSLIDGGPSQSVFARIAGPAMIALSSVTFLALVWAARPGKTIPLWMTVVCLDLGLEVCLSYLAGGRYTLGWYASRLEASVAAGLMLCVFLYYVNIALLLQANSMQMLASARDDAQRSAAENASLLRDYEREQRVASSFQRAALPATLPRVPGVSFDGFYAPGQGEAQIGGDWFDALRLPDGRIVLSIGDVAGSGLDAAVIMANVRQAIRGIAHVHTDPAMILEAADRVLRAEHPDRFVTAFVAIFDPMYGTLTYATAGHNRPLVRTPDGAIAELAGEGLPLGLRIRGDASHAGMRVEPGSLFVFYTDGLVESTRDLAAGERWLRDVIADEALRDSHGLARTIHDRVLIDGARDDVAILTMFVERVATLGGSEGDVGRWHFESSDAEGAGTARSRILAMLEDRGVRNADCIAVEVVFSELVGNVVRYAPGDVEILLDCTNPAPVLHVLDSGSGFSRFPELPRNLYSESGRGLFIVASLAEEFTVARRPVGGSHARAVLAVRAGRNGSA